MTERRDAVDAWESLYRAQVAVLRHLREHFPAGISFSEYDLLFNLFRAPRRSARIRDLVEQLLITQPSVSRLIDRLAARGLVAKGADPNDARGTLVTLTDEGEAFFRRVGTEHSRVIADRMLAALDADELRELGRLSERLRGGASPRVPADSRLPVDSGLPADSRLPADSPGSARARASADLGIPTEPGV